MNFKKGGKAFIRYILFLQKPIYYFCNSYISILQRKEDKKMYDIEELHESGKMPTRYYNQINGKSAQQNYNKLLRKRQKKNESLLLSII